MVAIWIVLAVITVFFLIISVLLLARALFRTKVLQWAKHAKRKVKNEALWTWRVAFALTIIIGVGEYVKKNNPLLSTDYTLLTILGFVLVGLSLWVAVSGLNARKQYFWFFQVLGPKEKLPAFSRTGIYATVRHPRELSILLLITGLAFTLGLKFALLMTVVILLPATMFLVSTKDRGLVDQYGKPYIEYVRNTKKLIPYIY